MLYQRWLQIVERYRHEIALADLATQQQWTFGQLDQVRPDSALPASGPLFPQGNRAGFILETLSAWRQQRLLCPLEPGQQPPDAPPPPPGIVHWKTTSATTQAARLVAFTAAQLMADATQIVDSMGLRRDWPNVGVISLAHSYGFSNLVLPLLLHGIPLWLLESPLPENLRQAEAVAPGVTLAGVPALWRAWFDAGAIPANVRLAISAGAPLPLPLEEAVFAKQSLKIHNFYGATECGGIAYDGGATPRTDPCLIGQPMRGVNLAVDESGCLEVRSGAVGETYWPEAAPPLSGGRYRTTDLAVLRGGCVYLRGRASDQINVAGRKVSPERIEGELLQHESVRDCLVFGAPSHDDGRSEIIVACVVTPETLGMEDLRRFLLTRLPAWQVPREWKRVDSLAPNERGKLSRAEWRRRLGYE
jgi:acyl-CoA synthetase (AMP-forming)/AMP-acid ligase II